MTDELEERVNAFRMMELPGQPMMMHMGTSHLVHDLWAKVKERDRLLVLATKHCPKEHHDWQELLKIAGDT